jgi:predicted short-subunit dehydrogenase-like oxidoreductase (DUF2520 family)
VASPLELVDVDVWLVGTGLESVPEVAASLPGVEGKVVAHFAGAAGVTPLADVTERGGYACALHPVQACPDVASAIARLPGSAWGATCTPDAEEWAADVISGDLAGRPVVVREADRPAWHAAAVITSNAIAALMAGSERILADLGIERPDLVLGPLAVGTAINAFEGGGGGPTLTGPVVRGETATLEAHLDALKGLAPSRVAIYKRASELVLEAALEYGRITEATARSMAEILR